MYVYVQCITYYEHVETAQNLFDPLKTVPSPRAKSVCRLESCAVICDSKSCNRVATWRSFSTGKGGVPTMK